MNKKVIVFIAIAIAIVFIMFLVSYFISDNNINIITLVKYNSDFNVEKTIEITKNKQIKEINKICENLSLEQDDITPYLAIRNDIKLDLGNGKIFMIQIDQKNYCYYENENTKLIIKMPEGLLEQVNKILEEN